MLMGCDGIFEKYPNRVLIESIRSQIAQQKSEGGTLDPQKIVNNLLINNVAAEDPGTRGGPIERGTDNQTCILVIFD